MTADRTPCTLPDLCSQIWELEQDLDLLNRTVEDVHFWPLIRMLAFFRLMMDLGLYGATHPKYVRRPWQDRRRAVANLVPDLRHNPWTVSGERPIVLLPHNRKVGHGREARDIYSHRLLQEVEPKDLLVLDSPDPDGLYPMSSGGPVRRLRLLRSLAARGAVRDTVHIEQSLREPYRAISENLRSRLGVDLPVSFSDLARRIALFRRMRGLYRSLFQKLRTRELFVVVAYMNQDAIAAAHDLGLPVYEFQHGTITPYHLGYSYPGRPYVPNVPDRLLAFGQFWGETTQLAQNTAITVIGSDNLDHLRARRTARVRRRVVVPSQGMIGDRLFDLIADAARTAPDWEFIFRLHPSEFDSAYILRLANLAPAVPNLRLAPPEQDFYSLLSSASIQVGVSSTALFEGMALGVRTIILPLPSHEYMTPVLDCGNAVLAQTGEEVGRLLDSAPAAADPALYYAAPVRSVRTAIAADLAMGSSPPSS